MITHPSSGSTNTLGEVAYQFYGNWAHRTATQNVTYTDDIVKIGRMAGGPGARTKITSKRDHQFIFDLSSASQQG